MSKFEVKIDRLEFLSTNLLKLQCSHVDGHLFRAQGGQFFMFYFDDGEVFNRSYSIANPVDGESKTVELVIALTEGGRSYEKIMAWTAGSIVVASGPHGRFRLKESDQNIVAVATGTGIAPFRSMLPAFSEKLLKGEKVMLIHGARRYEDAVYADEFFEFSKRHDGFSYHLCLSAEEKLGCTNGRVQSFLDSPNNEPDTTYFLCGNPNMVDEVKQILANADVNRRLVRTESYVSPS